MVLMNLAAVQFDAFVRIVIVLGNFNVNSVPDFMWKMYPIH
jgi:hypothetical protein